MKFKVVPVPAPRMTRQDRWTDKTRMKGRPAVIRYFLFQDELRLLWGSRIVPSRLALRFFLPMPPSWSKKKKLQSDGKPHQNKPDIDNLIKSFLDTLCENDQYVYAVKAEKYWSTEGYIEVEEY